jgi:hypothetical protein
MGSTACFGSPAVPARLAWVHALRVCHERASTAKVRVSVVANPGSCSSGSDKVEMCRSKWSGEVDLQAIFETKCIQSVSAAGWPVLLVVVTVASTHLVRVCLTTTI